MAKKPIVTFLILIVVIVITTSSCTSISRLSEPTEQTSVIESASFVSPTARETTISSETTVSSDIEQNIYVLDYRQIFLYNEYFMNDIEVDLNGDGRDEDVRLQPGRQTLDGSMLSVKISIDDQILEIEADDGYKIGPVDEDIFGAIIDIDKSDPYRELVIYQYRNSDDFSQTYSLASVLIYDGQQIQVLAMWSGQFLANGKGYVIDTTYSKLLAGDYSIALLSVKNYAYQTGFTKLESSIYRVQNYSSQIIGWQTSLFAQWDQVVSDQPGSALETIVLKGTRIHFGLFHESGWIEVLDSDGDRIGWLDLNKVDMDRFIDFAIQASCH